MLVLYVNVSSRSTILNPHEDLEEISQEEITRDEINQSHARRNQSIPHETKLITRDEINHARRNQSIPRETKSVNHARNEISQSRETKSIARARDEINFLEDDFKRQKIDHEPWAMSPWATPWATALWDNGRKIIPYYSIVATLLLPSVSHFIPYLAENSETVEGSECALGIFCERSDIRIRKNYRCLYYQKYLHNPTLHDESTPLCSEIVLDKDIPMIQCPLEGRILLRCLRINAHLRAANDVDGSPPPERVDTGNLKPVAKPSSDGFLTLS
jgi:hypothetical protein